MSGIRVKQLHLLFMDHTGLNDNAFIYNRPRFVMKWNYEMS